MADDRLAGNGCLLIAGWLNNGSGRPNTGCSLLGVDCSCLGISFGLLGLGCEGVFLGSFSGNSCKWLCDGLVMAGFEMALTYRVIFRL